MLNNGAKTLFNRLVQHNVKYVFGYPGGAILPVLNEFYNQGKIKYILSRTELGGGFMAEGYAKATKKPGILMVTSGPGAINTMTSLQNALSDGTPILALTGQVSTTVLGTNAFQEANIIGISKPCTKWNAMIKGTNHIEPIIDSAFEAMLNKRHGPVLLDLPKNIMSNNNIINNKKYKKPYLQTKNKINNIPKIEINEINKLIHKAEKPLILAGNGVYQSYCIFELRKLSELYNIPVTTTLLGLGVFDEKNPLSLKMLGMHGSYCANMAIQNCDLLINFGSRFDDRIIGAPDKFAPNAKIIHIDIDTSNIGKTIKPTYYVEGDCKQVINQMLNYEIHDFNNFNPYTIHNWINQLNKWKKTKFSFPNKNVLQGREVIYNLNNIIHNISKNTTIIADVGAHQMWAAQFIDYDYPKINFITSGGLGSMGYALPASIGYKIGAPHNNVICICGDGGFTMSFTELLTASENKINVKILIINNNYQLMVKMWQDKFYNNRLIGVKMNNPDFAKVAESLGCKSITIDSKKDLIEKLTQFVEYEDGPIVANVITDSDESVLPMVSPGKSLDQMIIEENNNKLDGEAPC
jgi:acetolactate synthase-1/2/3 large subunit